MFGAFLIAMVVGYPISNPTPEPLSYFFVYHAKQQYSGSLLNTEDIHSHLKAGCIEHQSAPDTCGVNGWNLGQSWVGLWNFFIGNSCFFVTLYNPFLGLT